MIFNTGESNKGAVKRVQSGIIPAGTSAYKNEEFKIITSASRALYIDIEIDPVSDISKCFVYTNQGNINLAFSIPRLINENTLRIYLGGSDGSMAVTALSAISWQVVEFY